MIDLHCHLLFGIDDGPQDIEGSVAIARRASEEGIDTIVATPHASSRHPNDASTIAQPLEQLRARLLEDGLPLTLAPGAEVAIGHLAEMADGTLGGLVLGGGSWLLIEPPFTTVAVGLERSIHGVMRAGYDVVLAHPERSGALHKEPAMLERLVADGVLTSLTAGSLVGRFGSQARRFAFALLERGLAHNVASDAHDALHRPPSIARELRAAGLDGLAEWLTDEVPRAILAGDDIPPRPEAERLRPRWRRWLGARSG
jgi:protein-tyrosine phosphatase